MFIKIRVVRYYYFCNLKQKKERKWSTSWLYSLSCSWQSRSTRAGLKTWHRLVRYSWKKKDRIFLSVDKFFIIIQLIFTIILLHHALQQAMWKMKETKHLQIAKNSLLSKPLYLGDVELELEEIMPV